MVNSGTTVADFEISIRQSKDFKLSKLQVYPNPTNGELNIYSPDNQLVGNTIISLFNSMGIEIERKELKQPSEIEHLVLQQLNNGLYFLNIQSVGKRAVTYRVVVLHD